MSLSIADYPLFKQFIAVVFWGLLFIYISMDVFWLTEAFIALFRWEPKPVVYGPDDIQIRVLTVDSEEVVQSTVNAIPDSFRDCHIISEAPMSISGGEVHVVPDDFECTATRKGRALEWARQNIPCDKEFVLFLDEDTVMDEFAGLPEADIVQLRESPQRTESWTSFFSEMYRMGFQIEQLAFATFRYPLYTWGGGLAIKKDLEDEVTWDVDSKIEDTLFVWRAALLRDIEFTVVDTKFTNQAPPSIREMIKQRRRWIAGSREDVSLLPPMYRTLYAFRDLSWGLSPLMPFVFLIPYLVPNLFLFQGFFRTLSFALFGFILIWTLIGMWYYGFPFPESLGLLVVSPVIVIPHAAGALYGMISKPSTFEVTTKSRPTVAKADTTRPMDRPVTLPDESTRDLGGASVLLLDPESTPGQGLCMQLLARAHPAESNVLLISDSMTSQEWVTRWEGSIGSQPDRMGIVTVGQQVSGESTRPRGIVVDRLTDPADIDYLAILIETYIRRWPANQTTICIDSLARLIDASSVEGVLGLISVIKDIAQGTDTIVHYHLNPSEVDPQVVRRISRDCDMVLEQYNNLPDHAVRVSELTKTGHH